MWIGGVPGSWSTSVLKAQLSSPRVRSDCTRERYVLGIGSKWWTGHGRREVLICLNLHTRETYKGEASVKSNRLG